MQWDRVRRAPGVPQCRPAQRPLGIVTILMLALAVGGCSSAGPLGEGPSVASDSPEAAGIYRADTPDTAAQPVSTEVPLPRARPATPATARGEHFTDIYAYVPGQ